MIDRTRQVRPNRNGTGGTAVSAAEYYDVIVVGAGPGGISCGALLAKWGLKTLVVDKKGD